jgi:hypothetical protein
MDRKAIDEILISALRKVKGIVNCRPVRVDDHPRIIEREIEAEKRSLMGLGKVVNTGVRKILSCDWVYAALTSTGFDWGCHSSLLLMKGEEIVGQEIRDKEMLAELADKKDVWFLHKNFVVYKDRISFPNDIMNKICHFEIPCLPVEYCTIDDNRIECQAIQFASPSVLCDQYLKERYFGGENAADLGTVLIGAWLGGQNGRS